MRVLSSPSSAGAATAGRGSESADVPIARARSARGRRWPWLSARRGRGPRRCDEDPTPTRENRGSAIFCASPAGARGYIEAPHQSRSVRAARRGEWREPGEELRDARGQIAREPLEQGSGQRSRDRAPGPGAPTDPRTARSRRTGRATSGAIGASSAPARRSRARRRARARSRQRDGAGDDDDGPDVHAPAEEPHRRRRRAMAAPVASAA